jgi:hypothetical protein
MRAACALSGMPASSVIGQTIALDARVCRNRTEKRRRHMINSLHVPDHPLWQLDPHYSFDAARALKAAYAWLAHPSRDGERFLRAYAAVVRFRDQPIARRQLMHVHYVLSSAYLDDGSFQEASSSLATALNLATELDDTGASAALLHLRGALWHHTLQLTDALADYAVALLLTRELGEERGQRDRDLESSLIAQMAFFAYHLADLETATALLHEAVTLAQESPSDRLNAGTLDWMRALLLRERGELMPALLPSVRAADAYVALGSPESAARAQQLAAAIMLDLAESLPSGTERNSYIDMAAPYVRRCLRLARSAGDDPGEGLGLLQQIRLDRLRSHDPKVHARLTRVFETVNRYHDVALQAHALNAEAHELAIQGQLDRSLNCYRVVLDTVRHSQVPVLAQPAVHALVGASLGRGPSTA